MRNKVDLSSDPDALFLNPWREDGLKLLGEPEFFWREISGGVIEGFEVSVHPEINSKIRSFVTHCKRQKQFQTVIETNTLPVVLDGAKFRKSHVMVGEKLVLSGASATRLFNTFRWDNETAEVDPVETLNAYLKGCRAANEGKRLAVEQIFLEPDLDFAIECRNTFNYFHFMTESLSQLCVLDAVGFQGNIFFHFPNQEEKQGEFALSFVEALFPEFAGRVFFERAPKEYDLVLTSYDLAGAFGQMPTDLLYGLERLIPADNDLGSIEFQPVLAMNSVSSGLLALRNRALKAIEGLDFSYLPKRIFVGRSDEQSRSRPLGGEEMLLKHLAHFGFEYVMFEKLAPLEQIALMAQAEVMISQHGAGFTNMLFANPDAYLIELGTLQTAQARWADFWPLAHAAQCTYLSFFADFNSENPIQEPSFNVDGIVPPALSEKAVAQVVTFVASLLRHAPSMPDATSVIILARRLLRAGAAPQTLELLDKHQSMVVNDAGLCLLRADCHKELDEPKSELVALEQAHAADPKRWQTLVRIIWCANRCERPAVIRWAVSRLAADFPDRHAAFISNHDWVRFVA
ncbi:glycosyltransferase family 61 protein [Sulfitobacter sp. S223]|uniref:glycosyltransferase family 61 protein n=1 Tax=Sulfitobacter sp. S223 TaxID=2867023 RepID=UPI0021A3DAF8|nr:glycosyltransferase family 61 protein [Sulfitobacter sp. S223]UWR26392.1 glycosyltransferase family 61 protein [Sulfitobacter sp. S223]